MNRQIQDAIALLKSGKIVIPAERPLSAFEIERVVHANAMRKHRAKKKLTVK